MRCIFCFIPSMAVVLALVEMATLATTLLLNLFVTLAIVGYMLAVRRRRHVYSSTTHRAMATTALLAVSAAAYTLLGGVLVLYGFRALGAAAPIATLWQIPALRMPLLILLPTSAC
jgi:TRAP-type C4-dicarboxylate transport system permease small subunit